MKRIRKKLYKLKKRIFQILGRHNDGSINNVQKLYMTQDNTSCMMSKEDVEFIEKAILTLNRKHLDVLEWGPGESTKHFARFLEKNDISYDWESLEYNYEWYVRMILHNLKNIRFHLFFEIEHDRKLLRYRPMNEYVEFPIRLNRKFDLIFIDGRKRKRCLENSLKLLKPSGIVILHDAFRNYYHKPMQDFDGVFLNNSVWLGRLKKL